MSSTSPFLKSAVVAMCRFRGFKLQVGRSPSLALNQFQQLRTSVRQPFGPGRTQVHIVFQANAAPAWKIDARLDRDHGVQWQRRLRVGRQPRRLVDLEAEAMAERVSEGVSKSARGNDLPGQSVALAGRHSGPE